MLIFISLNCVLVSATTNIQNRAPQELIKCILLIEKSSFFFFFSYQIVYLGRQSYGDLTELTINLPGWLVNFCLHGMSLGNMQKKYKSS